MDNHLKNIGGNLASALTFWKFSFYIFHLIFTFFMRFNQTVIYVSFYAFCNSMWSIYIPIRIISFSYSFFFFFIRPIQKGPKLGLGTTSQPVPESRAHARLANAGKAGGPQHAYALPGREPSQDCKATSLLAPPRDISRRMDPKHHQLTLNQEASCLHGC